ncbi:tetratricopeptide repeat protein, partial [Helicobacter pylori GAM231Ai]
MKFKTLFVKLKGFSHQYLIIIKSEFFNKRELMLGNFKKAIFRVLCLCCVLIGGGGLMAEPNPEELFNLGMLSYDKQDFSKARKYFEKACDLNNGGGCG